MSEINTASAEAQSLGVQENATVQKFKDYFKSLVTWSLAFIGAKDFLRDNQAIFIAASAAVAVLFGISWRIALSNRGTAFIGFVFLVLGYLIVWTLIDWVVPNSHNKWITYTMFLATVTTFPDHQHIFQEMKGIFRSMCSATSSSVRNVFNRLREIIEYLFETNVANQEESSMNNNLTTQVVGGDGSKVKVEEDNV